MNAHRMQYKKTARQRGILEEQLCGYRKRITRESE